MSWLGQESRAGLGSDHSTSDAHFGSKNLINQEPSASGMSTSDRLVCQFFVKHLSVSNKYYGKAEKAFKLKRKKKQVEMPSRAAATNGTITKSEIKNWIFPPSEINTLYWGS